MSEIDTQKKDQTVPISETKAVATETITQPTKKEEKLIESIPLGAAISIKELEDLIKDLSSNVTIVIVTHNMQQATRICDYAAVMMAGQERIGELIEYGTNDSVFGNPKDKRTEDYVTGRIG